jgi:tetratricopeptide (TPR) repeat protein
VEFNKKLLERGGDEPRLKYKRGDVYLTLGLLYAELENLKQSEAEYRRAKVLFGALLAADPDDDRALAGLATAANRLGNTLERLKRPSEAAPEYDEAIRLRRELVERYPADDHKIDLATSIGNLAALCSADPAAAVGRPDSTTLFREATAILQPLATDASPSLQAEHQFFKLQTNFAEHLFGKNDPEISRVLAAARTAFDRIVQRYPDRDDFRFEFVRHAYKVGQWYDERLDSASAKVWMAVAAEECGRIVDTHPGIWTYRIWYADILLIRATIEFEEPNLPPAEVVPQFLAALDQIRRLNRDWPGRRVVTDMGVDACKQLAVALTAAGKHTEALAVWDEAITYCPAERVRAISLRRELARVLAGNVTAAVMAARGLGEKNLTTAEEFGFYAAVLAAAAAATKDGKPAFPPDEANRLTSEAKSHIAKAKAAPDFARVRPELAKVPALHSFLDTNQPTAR